MGIRTWPGYELFGNDCICFDAGETPKKLYVSFSDIEICDNPACPPISWQPGTIVCDQDAEDPCSWKSADSLHYWCVVMLDLDGSSAVQLHYGASMMFWSAYEDPCILFHENLAFFDPPFTCGQGGKAQIFWRPSTCCPSVRGIMEKLNIEPHRNTMFEGFPLDDTHAVAKYCRTRDATNIKIKFET